MVSKTKNIMKEGKQMKKLNKLVVATLLLLTLTACGEVVDDSISSNSGNEEKQTQSEIVNMDDSETVENVFENQKNESEVSKEIIFQELTVIENEECAIKVTGIEPDSFWGYTLKVNLENKSTDKTYMFSLVSAAVDGVATEPLFASEVAAGKKANKEIQFMDSNLEKNGIVDFTDIELTFKVYDANDWMADDVARETVHVYPYGEDMATLFVREKKDTDKVIIDNEYVTVTVTGYEKDDIWGYNVNLFLENKTDKDVMFSIEEASVNGYMLDPFYATSVSAGKCSFSSITWFENTLTENGITEITELEFIFKAYDSNDWMADDFAKEKIILNP